MTINNFYLFDRHGTCLFYAEWNRKKQLTMSKEEEFKLMYGMIFSIKSFTSRLSPSDMKEGFLNFTTSKYKLHFFETPSGLKFIMNTDLNVGSMKDVLLQIFSSLYVDYVVKNPLCELDKPITSELFKAKLDEFVKGLPQFSSRTSS